jgi:SAM-dependent methyltransferase
MSGIDREKWNQRYCDGAYAERTHPSVFLEHWLDSAPAGRALDLACGAGRNALYLAQNGFEVDAVDISGEAIARGQSSARNLGVAINWYEWDLDESPLALEPGYQLILVVRYVNLTLVRELVSLLAPGGILLCEQHLETDAEVIGPSNPAFRVKPGELESALAGLQIIHLEEGLSPEPDGSLAALARVVARRQSSR